LRQFEIKDVRGGIVPTATFDRGAFISLLTPKLQQEQIRPTPATAKAALAGDPALGSYSQAEKNACS